MFVSQIQSHNSERRVNIFIDFLLYTMTIYIYMLPTNTLRRNVVVGLDVESLIAHAFQMRLDQLCTVLLAVLDDAKGT